VIDISKFCVSEQFATMIEITKYLQDLPD